MNMRLQICLEEIDIAIKRLKSGKAAGPDNIPGEIIKASSPMLLYSMQIIFKLIIILYQWVISKKK